MTDPYAVDPYSAPDPYAAPDPYKAPDPYATPQNYQPGAFPQGAGYPAQGPAFPPGYPGHPAAQPPYPAGPAVGGYFPFGMGQPISKPVNHLGWAITSIFLFWPVAIFAIVHANKVDPLWFSGQAAAAKAESEKARSLCIVATTIGLAIVVGLLLLSVLATAATR